MRCPNDAGGLKPRIWESDVAIDACAACGGAWLDAGELERIQETRERDHAEALRRVPDLVARAFAQARAAAEPERDCPRCTLPLFREEHGTCSQVLVDSCRRCGGVWLDAGELEALEVFFERARLEAGDFLAGLA